jgi:hypothetical protein
MITAPFVCENCFDTGVIDSGGCEIPCPEHVEYHPRAVTVEFDPDSERWVVRDRSYGPDGHYGSGATWAEAEARARVRRGVIKAALTRRANKAKREGTP